MPTNDDYLGKITHEHARKPNFVATVDANVDPYVKTQTVLGQIKTVFDIDTAIGAQLDVIGEWVGVSRYVTYPLEGAYFSWDVSIETGWDGVNGKWYGPSDSPNGSITLGDADYRSLIKGKISANSWDGSIDGAYDTIEAAFGVGGAVAIVDNQDMTQTVKVAGGALTSTQLAMLKGGSIPIKPAGVGQAFVTGDYAPLDGFIYRSGVLVANSVLFYGVALSRLFISAASSWADASLSVGPTAERVISLRKNGVVLGTITFAAGSTNGVPALLVPSVVFVPGDSFDIIAPATVDATATNLALSFVLLQAPI